VEFLVISIFHETKIRTVVMKVEVYSKFRKNKISKKVKSPNSMRNGRFYTSKCRGKIEKIGVLCTHSPISLGPFPKLPIIYKKKNLKFKKKEKGTRPTLSSIDLRPTGDRWSLAGLPLFFEFFFFSCPPLLEQVVNSCWLVPAHARLAQSSPKNFKHP
jgi:hypothetical protein